MDQGNIAAALTVVRTIRPEWDVRTIRSQIEALADGDHTHADILWVCVTVAENRNNQAPIMLTSVGPKLIHKLHEKTGVNRTWTGSAGKIPGQFKCDTCGKNEADCQSAANNLNGTDHSFVSAARRDRDRDQMHADGRIAAARTEALGQAKPGVWFALPADVTEPTKPEQESA